MSEMIEKVARKLAMLMFDTWGDAEGVVWSGLDPTEKAKARKAAEAALSAYNPNERLNYEEIAILHGQQVTVTFKQPSDAFDLFNELRDRGSALSPLPQGED